MRVFFVLMLLFFLASCDKFSFVKKQDFQVLDTIVDFTSVDTSPSFKECDSIFDKSRKSDCFRTTIHGKIGEELKAHQWFIKEAIDETVYVALIINSKGKITFENLKSSESIKTQLPELDSLIRASVTNLPTIIAANKRGIPVTTKYELPIRIVLKE